MAVVAFTTGRARFEIQTKDGVWIDLADVAPVKINGISASSMVIDDSASFEIEDFVGILYHPAGKGFRWYPRKGWVR